MSTPSVNLNQKNPPMPFDINGFSLNYFNTTIFSNLKDFARKYRIHFLFVPGFGYILPTILLVSNTIGP